jgi:hypothetical protein
MSLRSSVCAFVRTEQLDSHLLDCHEFWNPSIFRKYIEKFKISLKYDENNEYTRISTYIFYYTFLSSA